MQNGDKMSRSLRKFRASDEEWDIIKQNAEKVGMKPCTYVRRMAVEGQIKKFDMRAVNDVKLELIRIGTNINQIAAMVNATNSAYSQDVENLKKEIAVLKSVVNNWLKPLE